MNLNTFVRFFVFLICLVFYAVQSYSQLYVGGKIGFQMSKHKYDDKEYQNLYKIGFAPGYNLGLSTNIKIANSFDLYNEFNYSVKGTNVKSRKSEDFHNRLILNYFDFPMLLRTSFYKHPQYNMFAQIGPTIGIWMGGRGVMYGDDLAEFNLSKGEYKLNWGSTPSVSSSEVYIDEQNRIQFSLNVGIGSEIKLYNKHIVIVDLRYEMGHTYLSKVKYKIDYYGTGYGIDFRANNQVFMLSTAYLFNVQALRRKLMK